MDAAEVSHDASAKTSGETKLPATSHYYYLLLETLIS